MYSLTSLCHAISKRVLILLLVSFLSLASVFTLAPQPSYAQVPLNSKETGQTPAELTGRPQGAPLTPEEKIDNAYTYRRATGMREEDKQAENSGVLKSSEEATSNESLLDKARDLIENVTGQ